MVRASSSLRAGEFVVNSWSSNPVNVVSCGGSGATTTSPLSLSAEVGRAKEESART